MKTLVLYATKHGAAREIAQKMGKKFGDATVCDLKGGTVPPLDGFDRVVIGSSVYAGRLRKEARAYVAANEAALKQKPLGLFVSGMSPDGIDGYLNGNYPKELVAQARVKAMLGGAFNPAKGNFFESFVVRIASKKAGPMNTIADDKIAKFVKAMK